MAPTGSSLRSWASLLGFLEGDVAIALETMARRLQLLMTEEPHPLAGLGEPDGFGGIARRGELDRLLLSEWMLAEEEPLEFLRRMAMSELSYLRREQVEPRTSTRLVLLADVGPDQVGAPRLAHLAGLVVLHRRAEAQGVPLALGLLSSEPGSFHTGELAEQFSLWLRARSAARPSPDHLEAWLDGLDPTDRGWVFGAETALGERTADDAAPKLRHLSARELEWDDGGATSMEVVIERRKVRLPLPEPANAIALLRGQGLRRRPGASIERAHGPLRFPRFTGHARRLLCRTDRPDELLAISLPPGQPVGARHPRRHQFPGRVLAAAVIGTRTVALVAEGGAVRVAIVGKRLGRVTQIDVDPARLDLDEALIASIVEENLEPLHFASGRILVRLAAQWWYIDPPDEVSKTAITEVAASTAIDSPRIAYVVGDRIYLLSHPGVSVPNGRRVYYGPLGSAAYESADGEFTIAGRSPSTVRVEGDATVLGLTETRGEGPYLVVQSAGQRIIRLEGADHTRTLTIASGDVVDVSLHPTEPLLAIQRRDGVVEAFELPHGTPLAVLLPGPA